jgi:Amidohydrolase
VTVASLPEALQKFAGRIVDTDSHEMIPLQGWAAEFGEFIQPFADLYSTIRTPSPKVPNNMNVPDFPGDVVPIDEDSIWDHAQHGSMAPGSVDMNRRPAVMEAMGIGRQIVFPSSAGLFAALLMTGHKFKGFQQKIEDPTATDPAFIAKLFTAHNDWAIRTGSVSDKILPAGAVFGDTPAEVLTCARKLMDAGIRALWFIPAVLLGGESPAHDVHDELWAQMERRGVFGVLHIGGDGTFLATDKWADAPYFENYKHALEVNLNPWSLSVVHLAAQNYLTTMILGGVFERFPGLMFATMELTGHWVGPMMEYLDMWMANGGVYRLPDAVALPKAPSYYVRRNLRVTVFDWEPVEAYITRYGLDDVFCYASDYPHVEGGKKPMHELAARLAPLGEDIVEKFFCGNAEALVGPAQR